MGYGLHMGRELPGWAVRQANLSGEIERNVRGERRGIVLGNGYFSLTPMNEQSTLNWTSENSYTSWKITAGSIWTKRLGWVDAPVPSGKPAILIGAAFSTKIRAVAKAGGNPLDPITVEETARGIAADLGYESIGGRTHREITKQMTAFASATIHMAEWGPADTAGERRYEQQSATLTSGFELYVPGWGDVLDGLDSRITPSQLMVDLALDPTTPPVRLDVLARMSGPFAMQVKIWLEKVLFSIRNGRTRERRFTWTELHRELTHDYTRVDRFRAAFLRALEEVAHTRRLHGVDVTDFDVVKDGRRGGGTVLVVRRSPLLRAPALEL